MKKLLPFLFMMPAISFAQQADTGTNPESEKMLSKKGFPILPEAGDFGIGFDAVPFLEYAGNLFNGDTDNSVQADFQNTAQQLVGKYFLDENIWGILAVSENGPSEPSLTSSGAKVSLTVGLCPA